jgi:riboflavin kinase / FMN adenylyltransferase
VKVYRNIDDFSPVPNTVVTIGTFDGVHAGHRVILDRVKQLAGEINGSSVIITFNPHPQKVLHPEEKNIFVLNTVEEKTELIRKNGIDHLIILPFTKEFASVSYLDFIKNILVDKLKVCRLVIGYDHHYGKDREGQLKHLQEYGNKFNFKVEEITARKVEDTAVSSTKIRKALMVGDLITANKFLGYYYSFRGQVVKGDEIGGTIGFPTANLIPDDPAKLIPADGIYAALAEFQGKTYKGMLYIGMRSTLKGTKRVIEINIFNFDKNIYSEFLNVMCIEKLRDEIKFSGLDKLKEQLLRDKEKAEKILSTIA